MSFLGASNCIDLLSRQVAEHRSMKLQDPRAPNWPSVVNGSLFIDRSLVWAKKLRAAISDVNSPIVILMRLGVEPASLLFGALQAGLFPILMKPATPVRLLIEAVQETRCFLVAVPVGLTVEIAKHGFVFVNGNQDYAILRAPYPLLTHSQLPREPLIGILSSGSTGKPKIIVHTLDRVLHNAKLHADSVGLLADDTVALTLPLNFSAGLVAGLLSTLITGANGVFVDTQKVNPHRLFLNHKVSVCMATPATVMNLYDPLTLGTARIVTVGGDSLSYRVASELVKNCGPNTKIYSTYGMTEAGPRISSSIVTQEVLEYFNAVPLGEPLEGIELELKPTGQDQYAEELYVHTPTAMYGYLDQASETSNCQDRPFGAIRTGDLFKIVNDGLLFAGRSGRLIVRGGENIYPSVIESAILKYLDIDDVWVTSEPDEKLGQVAKAYIVGDKKFDINYMARRLRKVLPSSYIPAIWEYAEKLPAQAKK